MSSSNVSHAEASQALEVIEHRREQVLAEVNAPWWYWLSLAGGWIALGFLADYGPAWSTVVATLIFGTYHAAVAGPAISGRHGSSRLSIRREMVGRRGPALVLAFLVVMTILTVGFALILHADGARHPAALAGVAVAALVLAGGPHVMSRVRAAAESRRDA